ncbi:TetR family transcriptional regulator [Lactobacillus sp. CBA3605]|uniref:TetR/AcrR family transcriptional regulator n=1 Tax=Lactobacillus sp. CBA3605 TaxID=2099788 RepID=UPI000CFC5DB8|nr:TetR/AcrR family transcriptional regulator [Lactobacillus sp. CBA3605]AVK61008.1 TetR family transcriptional regulator [Lactobacillus sp. CBA3605]
MGKREAKKAAKRLEIFNVATKLFIKFGYDNVTTAEIAAQAHIAKKTLFQYFSSKENIIFDHETDLIDALIVALTAESNVWNAFVDFVRQAIMTPAPQQQALIPEALQLPQIIQASDVLTGRLLKMWDQDEQQLTGYFESLGYAAAPAQALAMTMINILRQLFATEIPFETLLAAHVDIANLIIATSTD